MDLEWAGKYDDAIQAFNRTIEMDPNMGRAYVGIAAILGNRGNQLESMHYYKLALEKLDSMSDREKYRTRGAYYLHAREPEKAEEELSKLVQLFPADSAGAANLAFAYFFLRDMPKALEEGRRAVEINPKNVPQRNNLGLYAMYAGDFATAIKEQQTVLELNPKFERAYVGMALSQLAQGQTSQANETYLRLAGVSALGASLSAAGLADIALLEGRPNDAVPILTKGIAADLEDKSPESAARGLTTLAETYLLQGKRTEALTAADKAIGTSAVDEVKFLAAQIFLTAGMQSKALPLAEQLRNSIETDSQAYAKIVEGQVAFEQGQMQDALRFFDDAKKIADTWWGRYTMARAYIAIGAYPEADSELEVCLTRRGEATALFLDEIPTYHLLPPVYYYLGRAQEGLKSPAAADSFRTFLSMKEKTDKDPIVLDAQRRIPINHQP
jgi:tetratricopeptide (TPR) repeat protein